MPQAARDMVEFLGQQIDRLDNEIERLDAKLKAMHKTNPVSDERLRQLLVLGATAVIRYVHPGQAQARTTKPRKASASASPWLLSLLKRRPRKVAAIALANKTARITWAMMTSGEEYRRTTLATA